MSYVGIRHDHVGQRPVAVIDFETTGLTAGYDRVVEVAVVRCEPGRQPEVAFDSLVNPLRPMAATEIHGISDADVKEAPPFAEIAGDVVKALEGCVIAAYNVYFDIKFLGFELAQAGVNVVPPHFCLMYLRPMLGLGTRCRLTQACEDLGVEHASDHMASSDALAAAKLLSYYLRAMQEQGIRTYSELGELHSYKFVKSFANAPLPGPAHFRLATSGRFISRYQPAVVAPPVQTRSPLRVYWDELTTALVDLEVTADELASLQRCRAQLGLSTESVRFLHARVFAGVLAQFMEDQQLDDREVRKLRRLRACLTELGWAPGD